MKIAVVTDSASYLTPKQITDHNIHVVPITVIFGQQTYLDNVEITTSEFYQRLKTDPQMPTTTQVTLGQMQTMYDQLAAEDYDAVISIHLSSGITTFYSNLVNYLPNVKNIKVYPFDSRIASAGEADLVMLAAKLVEAGRSPEEIMRALTHLRDTIDAYFVVDDLSHLVRTGRLSNASSIVGGLLRIKPILTFNDQAQIVAIEKERTMRRAYQRIKQKLQAAYDQATTPCVSPLSTPTTSSCKKTGLLIWKSASPRLKSPIVKLAQSSASTLVPVPWRYFGIMIGNSGQYLTERRSADEYFLHWRQG